MQTNLLKELLQTTQGQEADSILRSCVHCGFCTATCPTYQLLGDELDSPRGRIYLIKQVLEGKKATKKTRLHLDRCLSCRSCETTCPSGVKYGRLIDIGREFVEKQTQRNLLESTKRFLLRKIIPYPRRFSFILTLGQTFKPLLPTALKQKIPVLVKIGNWPQNKHQRKMLVLSGCAQESVTPQTNIATANVLDKLGIELITAAAAGCCGAVNQHLSASNEATIFIKNNIDAWWPYIEQGVEAIITTASGCGVMIKDYAHLLENDTVYAEKARQVSVLAKDISEILVNEDLSNRSIISETSVSFHSPCTLQHGLQLNGMVEKILLKTGYKLKQVDDSHLCCGSAGTYSILQPELSKQLLKNKVSALEKNMPDVIATANTGCQMHLSTKSKKPVVHWIELVEKSLQ